MIVEVYFYIVLSFLTVKVYSNLLLPEYSVKVMNTENFVLSLDDINIDNNDDLEITDNLSSNPELEEKLNDFHKFVRMIEASKKPTTNVFKNVELKPKNEFILDLPSINSIKKNFFRKPSRKIIKKKWIQKFERSKNFWKPKWILQKRAVTTPSSEDAETEYDNLEKEYENFVAESFQNNTAYKYTDEGQPEESLKDLVGKIVKIKPPENCTNITGVGIQAMECLIKNVKAKEMTTQSLFENIAWIFLAWFFIYLIVAIPFWCTKGWCCCCCRCSFCFPIKTIKEIQTYVAENPPGVFVNERGDRETYSPTIREKELYEKIKRSISDF